MATALEKLLNRIPLDSRIYAKKSLDISEQIIDILKTKGLSQRALAKDLGKSESEISKWLTGTHNFTIKSLSKIEAYLETDIIVTPKAYLANKLEDNIKFWNRSRFHSTTGKQQFDNSALREDAFKSSIALKSNKKSVSKSSNPMAA